MNRETFDSLDETTIEAINGLTGKALRGLFAEVYGWDAPKGWPVWQLRQTLYTRREKALQATEQVARIREIGR